MEERLAIRHRPEQIDADAFIAPNAVVLGVPDRVAREVGEEQQQMIRLSAEGYVQKGQAFKAMLTA